MVTRDRHAVVVCTLAACAGAHAADRAARRAWTTYALTEALIMGRDDQASAAPLIEVTGADPANVLISSRDCSFRSAAACEPSTEPGAPTPPAGNLVT